MQTYLHGLVNNENALVCRQTSLAPCFPAQPLLDLPPQHERAAYQTVVVQQHLSLWDSLSFTDKVNEHQPKNNTHSAARKQTVRLLTYQILKTCVIKKAQ